MMIRNGTAYASNYARAAAYFIATCAPAPQETARLAAYNFITSIYRLVFDDPASLGWKVFPDAPFAPWEQQKGREKDIKSIRDAIAKIESLVYELFGMVEAGECAEDGLLLAPGTAPGRTLARVLAAIECGVEKGERVRLKLPAGCAEALKTLAAISRAHTVPITDGPWEDKAYLLFSRVVFEPETDWTAQAFDRLLGADGRLIALCKALEARGYTRIDCRDGKRISLDYIKQHGRKAEPLKAAWAERTHSGIEVSFEELRLAPCFIWVRMPMFKTVLAADSRLPAPVREFLAQSNKRCDGCRYCVQTDKTGTRPLAAIALDGELVCPMFPGFSMNWRQFSPALCDSILALLDALDALPELN